MKKNILLIILLIFSVFSPAILLKASNNIDISTIDVQNTIIKKTKVAHSFIGVNWHADNAYDDSNGYKSYNEYIFTDPALLKTFVNVLKDTKIEHIRYPGGENVAHYFWDVSNEKIYEARKKWNAEDNSIRYKKNFKASNRLDFSSFLKFCKDNQITTTVQVNPHTYFDKESTRIIPLKSYERDNQNNRIWETGKVNWKLAEESAKSAAKQVAWAKNNGCSKTVAYWEIGNEEMVKVPLSPVYTGEEYGKVAALFIKEMKNVDPSIKIILTGAARPAKSFEKVCDEELPSNKWGTAVLNYPEMQKYKNSLYAVSAHTYPKGITKKDLSYAAYAKNIFTNPDLDLRNRLNFHAKQLKDSGYLNTLIFLNEFNVNSYNTPYARTWLGAIGNAKIIMSCANVSSCEHVDYFQLFSDSWKSSDEYSNQGYGVFHLAKDFEKPLLYQPIAKVIKILNENIKSEVLQADFSDKNLEIVSSVEKDIVRVVVLNKEKSQKVELKFTGFDKLEYLGNKSLGINVPETFTIIDARDSRSNPSEIRMLNIIDNAITVSANKNLYKITLPKNTLSVFMFKKVAK